MKKLSYIILFFSALVFLSCHKKKQAAPTQIFEQTPAPETCGPYGKISSWKSIGGDTLYSETLILSYFYSEKQLPCAIYYYSQSYPFWNDYDYTLPVSGCEAAKDTLIIKDIDSGKIAIFKREE